MESVRTRVKRPKRILCFLTKFLIALILRRRSKQFTNRKESIVVEIPLEQKCASYFPPVVTGVVTLTGTDTLTPTFCPAARMPSFAAMVVTNVFTIKFT